MPPKRRKATVKDGGTGYGGKSGDQKKLLAGRKRALKKENKQDAQSVAYLQGVKRAIVSNLSKDTESDSSGVERLVGKKDRDRIIDTLKGVFRNQVPTDWNDRRELYDVSLDVCRTLASDLRFGPMLGDVEEHDSLISCLEEFSRHAEQIIKHSAKAKSTGHDDDDDDEEMGDILLATQVMDVKKAALKVSRLCHKKKTEDLAIVSEHEFYKGELEDLRFEAVDAMDNHFFLKQKGSRTAPVGHDMRRLFKEFMSYRSSLPIEYGSSIFVRALDSRQDMLRAMITGPDETPYANGCFFFDIIVPPSYPSSPPKVQFLTTSGGRVRFNPNLYACGKVCLSLLGTWSGPGWVSGESTLLQVLISIQSLILVPEPYWNEPGYECQMGTERGKQSSIGYNRQIRKHTLECSITAFLSQECAYPEFDEVITKHFLAKRSVIEKQIQQWAMEDPSLSTSVRTVRGLFESLALKQKQSRRAKARATSADQMAECSRGGSGCQQKSAGPRDRDVVDLVGMKSAARKASEPVVLDCVEEHEHCARKPKTIDLVEVDEKKPPARKRRKQSSSSAGVIDLTG